MFKNKLVAVVNKKIETGVLMNSLAHLCIGLGASVGADSLLLMDYKNADGFVYPNISRMPFIILREDNSNKLMKLLHAAKESGIQFSAFTNTMTEGTWEDQEARTMVAKPEEIVYYGIVLFGQHEIVTNLTKKLSLFR